jgi:hypothetical protein
MLATFEKAFPIFVMLPFSDRCLVSSTEAFASQP